MSLSVDPVPVLVADDPRIDLDVHPYYLVERSAGEVIYRDYPSDSFGGGTININTQISDRRTVVSSKVFVKTKFSVVATANGIAAAFTAGSQDILLQTSNSHISPRFSPLISSCTNCVLGLNGKQFGQPVGRYFTPLMKYCSTTDEVTQDFSTFPSHQDILQEPYSFITPTGVAMIARTSSDTSLLSAIGNGYEDGEPYTPSARLGWFQSVANVKAGATATSCTFEYESEEIIPISPLVWGHKEVKGISGIDTLNLYLNYDSGLLNNSMIYSSRGLNTNQSDSATISFAVTITECSAEFIYFSPRVNVEIPPVLRYRFNNIQHIPKDIPGNIAAYPLSNKSTSVSLTQVSDAITLQGMPKRMYVFIRRQQSTVSQFTLDTYARITKINLQIGNRAGILAEATPQSLYRMAVKNGYQGTWDQWYNVCGSVLCIDFAQDIPLGLLEAPGTLSKQNMQFTVTFNNLYFRQRKTTFYHSKTVDF